MLIVNYEEETTSAIILIFPLEQLFSYMNWFFLYLRSTTFITAIQRYYDLFHCSFQFLHRTSNSQNMPIQIKDIRDFLQKARRNDAKLVKIRKRDKETKFKIRCSRYLYTLRVSDAEKADKLTQSLPPGLQRKNI